jgi:hypothetical protein
LTDFTAFKAKYTAAFITAQLAEIDTAANLPDYQARAQKQNQKELLLLKLLILAYQIGKNLNDTLPMLFQQNSKSRT